MLCKCFCYQKLMDHQPHNGLPPPPKHNKKGLGAATLQTFLLETRERTGAYFYPTVLCGSFVDSEPLCKVSSSLVFVMTP
jgi:hypothetical protein